MILPAFFGLAIVFVRDPGRGILKQPLSAVIHRLPGK
jgi:hypothetical protein